MAEPTIVVETGASVQGANSYADVAYADAYAELTGNASGWSGRASRVELSLASNPVDGDSVTIGGSAYTFKDTLASARDVKIGSTANETLENLRAALDASGTDGVEYAAGTTAHATVTAEEPQSGLMLVKARTQGVAGDSVTVSASMTDASNEWDGSALAGGSARVTRLRKVAALLQAAEYLDFRWGPRFRGQKVDGEASMEWPRWGAHDDSGYLFDSDKVPECVKRAQCALAFATLDEANPILAPNVTLAAPILRQKVVAGPVTQDIQYGGGGSVPDGLGRVFSMAEMLLRQVTVPPGQIRRG